MNHNTKFKKNNRQKKDHYTKLNDYNAKQIEPQ